MLVRDSKHSCGLRFIVTLRQSWPRQRLVRPPVFRPCVAYTSYQLSCLHVIQYLSSTGVNHYQRKYSCLDLSL
jgi:hypothetical protein